MVSYDRGCFDFFGGFLRFNLIIFSRLSNFLILVRILFSWWAFDTKVIFSIGHLSKIRWTFQDLDFLLTLFRSRRHFFAHTSFLIIHFYFLATLFKFFRDEEHPLKDQLPHFFLISLLFFADQALGKRPTSTPSLFTTIKKPKKDIYTHFQKDQVHSLINKHSHSFITL